MVGSSTSGRPSTLHLSLFLLLRLYCARERRFICSSLLNHLATTLCRATSTSSGASTALLLLAGHGHSLTVHRKTDATSTLILLPYHRFNNECLNQEQQHYYGVLYPCTRRAAGTEPALLRLVQKRYPSYRLLPGFPSTSRTDPANNFNPVSSTAARLERED